MIEEPSGRDSKMARTKKKGSSTKNGCTKSLAGSSPSWVLGRGRLAVLGLGVVLCGVPAYPQTWQTPAIPQVASGILGGVPFPSGRQGEPPAAGTIRGTVVDPKGVPVGDAVVSLTRDVNSSKQEKRTGDDGTFSFAAVVPGAFQLTITAEGFAPQTYSGNLSAGESQSVRQITLAIATNVTEVMVTPQTQVEIAEEQLKEQEKQRVAGFFPNFYVTYIPDAVSLNTKQKFKLAWKLTIDPVSFGLVGAVAGIQQASDEYGGYGQGAQGYGKRYGAAYATFVTGTFIGSAMLPSILKQDPRYFYKGTGTKKSRLMYAIANSVICKGDNGKWQPNYSGILGSLAAGGISNFYYAPEDRTGVGLTFENALIGIGTTAAANILQEFVIKKITPAANQPKPLHAISRVWNSIGHESD